LSGYNTTAGGSRFVESSASASLLPITSQQPLQSFGAYVTGAQPGSFTNLALSIRTTTGALALIPIPTSSDGAALFVGVTGEPVIVAAVLQPSITLTGPREGFADIIGLDDVRLGFVPEPSTSQILIMSLAALALFDFGWRRRNRAQ